VNRIFLALALLSSAHAAVPALMPLPVKAEAAAGGLIIDNSFSVVATGFSDPRLASAVNRFVRRIARQTGIPILPNRPLSNRVTLTIECAARGPEYPTLGEDESYTLNVEPGGSLLKAPAVAGVLHGLATFTQLVGPSPDGGFQAPAIHIEDRPRFPWRGLMLDASRHWMPVEVVKRNLDAMADVKLNVFHWHLSDDQGFRVESKRFPKLQGEGSDGLYYTQDEIRDVVAYARDRGIRVVPEFDIPGHTQSWLVGYPELATNPGPYTVGRTWGIYFPVMDPTKEELYTFLDGFFAEMAPLFPDPYFHIGGDEVKADQWKGSATVQAFMRAHQLKDEHALQAYFNQRVQKLLEKNHKIMIGWDEILHPDLPQNIVVQSWRGQKSVAEAAAKGYRGILSWGYYLDHLSPASFHYNVDPLGDDNAKKLTADQSANILGGEACMWAEYVNAETVDSRIWPRAAAIAERFWSPQSTLDPDSMYARMQAVSRELEWSGVRHRANYAPMLDRLAGGRPAEPLRVLADAFEAQGLGVRARAQKYTSLISLNRFVDAVRPESEVVRWMEQAVKRMNPADVVALRSQFTTWAENDARLQPLLQDDGLLAEVRPLSKDLSALGAAGLKMLDYIAQNQAAPAGFVAEQTKELARMQRPAAEVGYAAARPVRLLLEKVKK
jgi:hexosaminidase